MAEGTTPVTVYARAYPEAAAYDGTEVPYQGQPTARHADPQARPDATCSADKTVPTDYYYAKSYQQLPARGQDGDPRPGGYYQVWVGHRLGYVKAAEVSVLRRR